MLLYHHYYYYYSCLDSIQVGKSLFLLIFRGRSFRLPYKKGLPATLRMVPSVNSSPLVMGGNGDAGFLCFFHPITALPNELISC